MAESLDFKGFHKHPEIVENVDKLRETNSNFLKKQANIQ